MGEKWDLTLGESAEESRSLWLDPACGVGHDAWLDREGITGALRCGEQASR